MSSNNDNDVVYEKIINKKNCISQFIIRWLNFMYAILYEQFLKFSHILLVEIEIKQHLMNLTIKGTIWQEMIFQYSSIITKRCPKIKKKSIKDITQVVYAANDIKKIIRIFFKYFNFSRVTLHLSSRKKVICISCRYCCFFMTWTSGNSSNSLQTTTTKKTEASSANAFINFFTVHRNRRWRYPFSR